MVTALTEFMDRTVDLRFLSTHIMEHSKMHSKEQLSLTHSATLRPEDFLRFVEVDPFPRLWSSLKLEDRDLQALQIGIMAAPSIHPVIPGTNGLRKL